MRRLQQGQAQITAKAIDIFVAMQRTSSNDEWWKLHKELVDELRTPPWEYPVVRSPDEQCDGRSEQEVIAFYRARERYNDLKTASKMRGMYR
jgi:hypothetical protein